MSARELGAYAVLLAAVAAAAFGSHVAHGGFNGDDWVHAATYVNAAHPAFFHAFSRELSSYFIYERPGLALTFTASSAVFGDHMGWHLALGLALAVLFSGSFYALLRTFGMERLHAGVVGLLVLLFPLSDTTRLWATGAKNTLGLSLWLIGATVALRGSSRRRHAAAVALYVASVLTYELAAVAILLTGLLYGVFRGWRWALRRWPWDVVAAGGALAWVAANTNKTVQPLSTQLHHLWRIQVDALTIIARSAFPFGTPRTALVIAVLVAVAVAGALAGGARRWLLTAGAAVVGVEAGYAMLIPGNLTEFSPITPGGGNRNNALAALAIVLLIYALAMVAGVLVSRAARRPRFAPAVALGLSAMLVVGYVIELDADKGRWDRAYRIQRGTLAGLERSLGDPPHGTSVFEFGAPIRTARGISAFYANFDLSAALQLRLRDPTLRGYPVYAGADIPCIRAGVAYPAMLVPPVPYGRAVFVDVVSVRRVAPRDPSQCTSAARTLHRSPYFQAGAIRLPN